MKKSLMIVLIALCSTPCFALDGNELLGRCEDKDDGFQASAYCTGYVAGAADTLVGDSWICTSSGVTHGQMRKVVEKYLRNNPEYLHYDAVELVKNALQKAFSCE